MTFESVQSFATSWGLLLFIAAFVMVLIYALAPGNRDKFRKAAKAPLQDDPPPSASPQQREKSE